MRRTMPVLLLIVAAVVLPPATARAESTDFAQACVRFQQTLDAGRIIAGFPGGTAAFVLADGRSAAFATGWADGEAHVPMTPETRSMSGSVGKTFVSAVVLSLVHEGTLELDGKIAAWLGDEPWFARLPNGNDITLRHLLTHSSGLTDHVYSEGFQAAVGEALAQEPVDLDWVLTPRKMVEFVLDKEPLFPAGEGYAYTDTGYLLVGLIIERVTGIAYYDELQRRLLDPHGLARTSPSNRRDLAGLTPGYMAADNAFGLPPKTMLDGELLINPAMEWTGGGLVTNSLDLARWAKLLYEGRALDGPYVDDLFTGVPRGTDETERYGLGVYMGDGPFGPEVGHGGWFPGYRTIMRYFPDHQVAVAMQVNTDTVNDALPTVFNALVRAVLDTTP